jgi:hypothetical protein
MVGLGPWPPRHQDAFCWFDLRSRDRSRPARAPFDVHSRLPRTLSPTANRPLLSSRGRHVKLTRQSVAGSGPASVAPGRCVSPTSATDCHHEHPVRSLGSRITALSSFRRGAQLPRRLPGRNLGRQHDRVEPRLTSRLALQRGRLKVPSVSRGAWPCSVLWSSSRSSPSSAPSSRRCRPGVKVVVLPLTPSLELLPAGLWDLTPNVPRARAPRTASARRAVKRDVLHRSRAPGLQPCDPRAQPQIA